MSSRIWLLALGLPNVVWAAALDSDGGGLPDHVESELGTDASDPGDDELCGDGVVVGGEECDDGNTDDHDGCDSLCVISPGYTCWSRDLNLQVKNPGWETPDGGNQINTTPTSWTLESGSVDHYQWTHYHYSADNYAVDMAGSPGIGVVYQDVATTPGETYRFPYLQSQNPFSGSATKTVLVSAAVPGASPHTSASSGSDVDLAERCWDIFELSFTATSSSTRIRVQNTYTSNSGGGPVIDPLTWSVCTSDVDANGVVDLCDGDADGDGLDGPDEDALGTDPANPDGDGDGLNDGDELNTHGTDPTDADTCLLYTSDAADE